MRYAFFPGCIARNIYPGLESSTRLIATPSGIELIDLGFSCCPPPGLARSHDEWGWMLIASRNLALAEQAGLDLLSICNGCYSTFRHVHSMLSNDPELLARINRILERVDLKYGCRSKPIHLLDLLLNLTPKIKQQLRMELNLKLAVHYGCHYLKPRNGRSYREMESPERLERFLEQLGCQPVEYPYKLLCCGAGGGVWSGFPSLSLTILKRKLEGIETANPDGILTICSFCHMQLDQGQARLGRTRIPVIHLAQLIGLGLGIKDRALGLHLQLISTRDLLRKLRRG